MESMFSKMLRNTRAAAKVAKNFYDKATPNQKVVMQAGVGAMLMVLPELAFAQATGGGGNFFCYIAQYFKGIVGSCALVVIVMWAIEHLFKVAKMHDVVIGVGVCAAIVTGAATLIANSGLTSTCTI